MPRHAWVVFVMCRLPISRATVSFHSLHYPNCLGELIPNITASHSLPDVELFVNAGLIRELSLTAAPLHRPPLFHYALHFISISEYITSSIVSPDFTFQIIRQTNRLTLDALSSIH